MMQLLLVAAVTSGALLGMWIVRKLLPLPEDDDG